MWLMGRDGGDDVDEDAMSFVGRLDAQYLLAKGPCACAPETPRCPNIGSGLMRPLVSHPLLPGTVHAADVQR